MTVDGGRETAEAPRAERHTPVRRFYLYLCFENFQPWIPIWVVYLQVQRGLSLTEIMALEAVYQAVLVAAEVPTGAVADRWGRKFSLLLGSTGYVLAILLFGLADGFGPVLVAYVAWAVAMTLRSGADTAFLYDTLAAAGRAVEFSRAYGRGRAVWIAAGLAAGLLGAPLADATSLQVPVLAGAAFAGGAFLVVLTFREPPREGTAARPSYLATLREAAGLAWWRRDVGLMLVMVALLQGAATTAHIFSQPFLAGHGVPVGAFGLLVMPAWLVSIAGSLASHRLAGRFGERAVVYGVAAGVTAAFLVLGGVPSLLAFAMFPVVSFCAAAFYPVHQDYLGRHAPQHLRATMLSMASAGSALLMAGAAPLLGLAADEGSLRTAFLAGGAVLGTLAAATLAAWTAASRREREAVLTEA
ncbi:MAG TPA: MFS transporter [Dehalococcoidia bacterium]